MRAGTPFVSRPSRSRPPPKPNVAEKPKPLDDAAVEHRLRRGSLKKLDWSTPTPIDEAAVARLREHMDQQRRRSTVADADDGADEPRGAT
jgi:hypothetical protein